MFFFGPPNHLLLNSLREFPKETTLLEFRDSLYEFFASLEDLSPKASPSELAVIEDLGRKLKIISAVTHRGKKMMIYSRDSLLRTLRHMLYGHKDDIATDSREKEIKLDHQARVQILLAKKLSIHRIPSPIRSMFLGKSLPEMETLLTFSRDGLKEAIAEGMSESPGEGKTPRPKSRLERRAPNIRKILRIPLGRGPGAFALEIDEREVDRLQDDSSRKFEALENILDYLFDIPSQSPELEEILKIISEHSPQKPSRK